MSTQYSSTEIGRLPPELMALIFKHVHGFGYPTSIRPGEVLDIDDRGMFGLSHVCTRWREIVLSLGSLWACKIDVSICCPAFNRLVLERAGAHQLDISLRNASSPHGYENLLLWLKTAHQSRAETIDIRCFGGRFSSILSQHVGPSLPTLQNIRICVCNLEYEDDDSQDSFEADDLVLVQTLAISNAPVLTSAVLYNCVLLWHADVFSQLTRLHIDIDATFSSTYGQQPTHAELRIVLTGMRKLVDLYLLNLFPDTSNCLKL
ncbi:hypothetical protein PENSPDRAFT_692249 [Peniophora sp. CONT]|nr:hypothetical protein PENSPDRAFT_692249 [Peniophora sp. CONT]